MHKPRICAAITENNPAAVKALEPLVDLFEVRLDLVGPSWPEIAGIIGKPWIACNRCPAEGGRGHADEEIRVAELLRAVEAGAAIADIELRSQKLERHVERIRAGAKCLISCHDLAGTPPLDNLLQIVQAEIDAGADICKLVTTARQFSDNITLLKLIKQFPGKNIAAFAMGEEGKISRILSPLAGGYLTYACLDTGRESAAGQVPVRDMIEIFDSLRAGQTARGEELEDERR